MNEDEQFALEGQHELQQVRRDDHFKSLSNTWYQEATRHKYSYHFRWLGLPIIQYPQDIVALQEIIFQVRPELIIETGIARGGSLILYASILELLGGSGMVLGVDIDIREHNRKRIEEHPLQRRITMLEGSSTDPEIAEAVRRTARGRSPVIVILDSNHTHDHVRQELALYSGLVTEGSYLVVFDTIIEDLPDEFFADRPWSKGNNPRTAVREFLASTSRFEVDIELESSLLITAAPGGYLRCVER